MSRPTPLLHPIKLLPALALVLLAALAALLCRPAPSSAKAATSACPSASTHAKQRVRACAGRTHSGHSHGKAKGRHSGHHHPIHRKKATQHSAVHSPAAVAKPATCEDGSQPINDGESSFSCADGSEPVCASGAEPTPAKSGAKLLCPAPTASGAEWSEAECEDGSAPERSPAGSYACEDGSRPGCPDGSQPTLSDDGSMLVCLAQGAPSSPAPGAPAENLDEGESEDAARSRVAIAS